MPRPSKVKRLPERIQEEISRLRQAGKTIDEILDYLRAMMGVGDGEVSRSGLGRHIQSMEKVGERLRRSRELALGLAAGVGDGAESKLAQLNIEIMHSVVYDFLSLVDEEGEEADIAKAVLKNPKGMALMAETAQRLTIASRHNLEYVKGIEKRAEERAKRKAAQAAETVGRERGLSADLIDAIKTSILGVA